MTGIFLGSQYEALSDPTVMYTVSTRLGILISLKLFGPFRLILGGVVA